MESKKFKITFSSINDGKYTVISKGDIAMTNQRVKTAMKDVVRTYEKKESISQQQAAKLVLNA